MVCCPIAIQIISITTLSRPTEQDRIEMARENSQIVIASSVLLFDSQFGLSVPTGDTDSCCLLLHTQASPKAADSKESKLEVKSQVRPDRLRRFRLPVSHGVCVLSNARS